jgi:hypothetical protein
MIRDLTWFPLDQCCLQWLAGMRSRAIQLTMDGYCLAGSDEHLSTCPFCGGDKRGRLLVSTPLTS